MPTDEQIDTWSDAFDALQEANKRLARAISAKDKALKAYQLDHAKALEVYEKASEELG